MQNSILTSPFKETVLMFIWWTFQLNWAAITHNILIVTSLTMDVEEMFPGSTTFDKVGIMYEDNRVEFDVNKRWNTHYLRNTICLDIMIDD